LRVYESVIVSRFLFSRKFRGAATFDFCNTIGPLRTCHHDHVAGADAKYIQMPRKEVTSACLSHKNSIDPSQALNGVTDPMSPKTTPKSDQDTQSKRLIGAARDLKSDQSESGANRSFDKFIRGARPKGPSPKQKDSR
jgi:hypothetical protein